MSSCETHIQALLCAAHPGVRDDAGLPDFIRREVLHNEEIRPLFIHEVPQDLALQPLGFVYDRLTGLLFQGKVEALERAAAALMQLHAFRAPMQLPQSDRAMSTHARALASQYVEDGFGFVATPAMETGNACSLHVGQEVRLSAQEQLCFHDLPVHHR